MPERKRKTWITTARAMLIQVFWFEGFQASRSILLFYCPIIPPSTVYNEAVT